MSYRAGNSLDKNLSWNIPLNDEQEVLRQQGVPSGTYSFSQGSVVLTTDGKITFSNPIYEIKSIRLIIDLDSSTEDIIQLSSTHSVTVSGGTITAAGFNSPTIYVDGVLTSTIGTDKSEVVITTDTSFTADDIVVGYVSSYLEGTVYLVQLWRTELSLESISNLNKNSRYTDPQLSAGKADPSYAITAFSDYSGTIDGATKVETGAFDLMSAIPQGAELVTNGDFSAWTGDNPDGWSITGEVASDPMITEVSGKCRLYTSDGTFIAVYKTSLTIGKYYIASLEITSSDDGTIAFGGTGNTKIVSAVGTHYHVFRATTATLWINRGGSYACDITFDNVSIKELQVLGSDLVTNGDFASDSDWEKGTGWTLPGTVASCSGAQSADSDLSQAGLFTSGDVALVKYTVSGYSAGNVCAVGGTVESSDKSANGTYTDLIITDGTGFAIRADADFTGSIDNLSVHKLTLTKEIADSTNYEGTHYILPVDENDFCIPVDYVAEAISAQVFKNIYTDSQLTRSIVMHLSSNKGVILDKWGNTTTNTDVTIVKDGSIRVMDFNGSTSLIETTLTDEVNTVMFWMKPKTHNESIMDLGGGNTIALSNDRIVADWAEYIYVNGAHGDIIDPFEWNFICLRSDPLITLASSEIGNIHPTHYKGQLSDIVFINGIVTVEEFSQAYTVAKSRFGK